MQVVREGNQKLLVKDILKLTAKDFSPQQYAAPANTSTHDTDLETTAASTHGLKKSISSTIKQEFDKGRSPSKTESTMSDGQEILQEIAVFSEHNDLMLCFGTTGQNVSHISDKPGRASMECYNRIMSRASIDSHPSIQTAGSLGLPRFASDQHSAKPKQKSTSRATSEGVEYLPHRDDSIGTSKEFDNAGIPNISSTEDVGQMHWDMPGPSPQAGQGTDVETGVAGIDQMKQAADCVARQKQAADRVSHQKQVADRGPPPKRTVMFDIAQPKERSLKGMKNLSKSMTSSFIHRRDRRNIQLLQLSGAGLSFLSVSTCQQCCRFTRNIA